MVRSTAPIWIVITFGENMNHFYRCDEFYEILTGYRYPKGYRTRYDADVCKYCKNNSLCINGHAISYRSYMILGSENKYEECRCNNFSILDIY